MTNTPPQLSREFDPDLWEGGVEDGAFSGDRDPDSVWYVLKVGDEKVAMASAIPGPGDLTTISYYVAPEHRGHGYGTKIASRVTDLHEKATFTIFKDNEASIKVALAALRNKFSATLGHNVVRLTKEGSEKTAIDPLLLTAIGVASVGGTVLGRKLGLKLRELFARHRKSAATQQGIMIISRARQLSRKGKMPSGYRIEETAKAVEKLPTTPMAQAEKGQARGVLSLTGKRSDPDLERRIRKAIRSRVSPQGTLF